MREQMNGTVLAAFSHLQVLHQALMTEPRAFRQPLHEQPVSRRDIATNLGALNHMRLQPSFSDERSAHCRCVHAHRDLRDLCSAKQIKLRTRRVRNGRSRANPDGSEPLHRASGGRSCRRAQAWRPLPGASKRAQGFPFLTLRCSGRYCSQPDFLAAVTSGREQLLTAAERRPRAG